jgi:glycine oxidase
VKAYDVAIIGGGVIGASIAFELANENLQVVVLDRQQPGQEASWAAAGMLSPAPDSPRDLPLVPLGRESLRLYPKFVAAIEDASGQCVGYERAGALELIFGPHAEQQRDGRVAECRKLGIAAEAVSIQAARSWENAIGPDTRAAVWLPEEGRVEPRLLTNAVILAAQNRGAEFRARCPVTQVLIDGGTCHGITAGGEEIQAAHVILAAGCFSCQTGQDGQSLERYAPTRPVRGQVISLRPAGLALQRVVRSERGYLVPRRDGRIVAGSTSEYAGFEKKVTPEGIRKILDATLELVPGLSGASVVETWSGLRPGTPDDLPILGPTDVAGLLIATGHYRNGILLAAITAKLIREGITTGRASFAAEAFSPLRFAKSNLHARHAF